MFAAMRIIVATMKTMCQNAKLPRATLTAMLMLVAVAGAAAVAGPLEDALAAVGRGDYPTALPLFRSLADQGNARARP